MAIVTQFHIKERETIGAHHCAVRALFSALLGAWLYSLQCKSASISVCHIEFTCNVSFLRFNFNS